MAGFLSISKKTSGLLLACSPLAILIYSMILQNWALMEQHLTHKDPATGTLIVNHFSMEIGLFKNAQEVYSNGELVFQDYDHNWCRKQNEYLPKPTQDMLCKLLVSTRSLSFIAGGLQLLTVLIMFGAFIGLLRVGRSMAAAMVCGKLSLLAAVGAGGAGGVWCYLLMELQKAIHDSVSGVQTFTIPPGDGWFYMLGSALGSLIASFYFFSYTPRFRRFRISHAILPVTAYNKADGDDEGEEEDDDVSLPARRNKHHHHDENALALMVEKGHETVDMKKKQGFFASLM